ncbi:response regulator [Aliidiomarina haloalkalitolerans]|uniref:Two-component system response regulator n=1 Tax=Aliidiomarina haloalkalitolerans TaxID=859059 RepID=A0A432VXU3_9GAMM|nr:response regulator [Aliidiomarina haloalkalitolerans]RUO21418.1 two-component system response regulator [Aliidiomarina haloalkalitolerans]
MKTILIADDDFISLEVLKAMLSRFPVEVITATNGTDALSHAQQHQPQLLILDYEMADYTGAEVCQQLRQIPAFSDIPIIALTGHQSPNELEACRQAGMNQTLHKPVAPDAIEQLLTEHGLID